MIRPSIQASNTPTRYGTPAAAYKPSHGGYPTPPTDASALFARRGFGKPAPVILPGSYGDGACGMGGAK